MKAKLSNAVRQVVIPADTKKAEGYGELRVSRKTDDKKPLPRQSDIKIFAVSTHPAPLRLPDRAGCVLYPWGARRQPKRRITAFIPHMVCVNSQQGL